MRYVLLICDDETVSPTNEELEADPVHQAWAADLDRRGAELVGARLRPVVDAPPAIPTRVGAASRSARSGNDRAG